MRHEKLPGTVWAANRTLGTGTGCSHTSNIISEWLRADQEGWALNPLLNIYFRVSRFQSLLLLSYFRYELHTATTGGSNLSQLSDMWRSTRYGNRAEITVLNPYSIWFFVPTQEISSIHLLRSILLHDCFTDKILWNPRTLIYPSRDSHNTSKTREH